MNPSRDFPLSVPTTTGVFKTNVDYNMKVVLILLIAFASENTPRSWAPRDLVLTWYTSVLRQTQQPVPEELVGGNQQMHKKDIAVLKGVFYLLRAAHGDYYLSWTMHRLGTITPTPCPPKYSLMTSSESILISWHLRRLTESRFIRWQNLTFSSKPMLCSQSHHSVSKSGVTLHSFVVPPAQKDAIFQGNWWFAFTSSGCFMWHQTLIFLFFFIEIIALSNVTCHHPITDFL